jgi:hypothetical protein
MLMNIKMVKVGGGVEQWAQDIQFKFIKVMEGTAILSDETRDYMRNTIQMNKRREGSANRLERSINSYKESNTAYGVGLITEMDTYAPYWKLINWGGFVSEKARRVPGYFGNNEPPSFGYKGTGIGWQSFTYTPNEASADRGGTFFMKVDSPIMAMNYIEKTTMWLSIVWKVHFYNWTRETKIHTK